MNWKELGNQLIDRGLPALGAALGGPAGASVGLLLASTFGSKTVEPKEILKQITLDPSAQIKLLELEKEYELKDKREDNLNTADARKNNTENKKISDELIKGYLVVSITIIVYLCIHAIINQQVQGEEANLISIIIGMCVTAIVNMINFYWGSSSSSRMKDEALAKRI